MNEWIDQYKQYHANENTNYPGNNLKPQLHHIKELVLDTKSETLLDYGCGKGLQYSKWNHHEDLGVMPTLYDPAVPEYENLPDGPFHGVFSTDVLEAVLHSGIQGLVLMTYGMGNAPCNDQKFLHLLAAANHAGIIIVNCTQCIKGTVDMSSYETGHELLNAGVISGFDMTPEATLTKLSYLLSTECSTEEIKQKMQISLRGELTRD